MGFSKKFKNIFSRENRSWFRSWIVTLLFGMIGAHRWKYFGGYSRTQIDIRRNGRTISISSNPGAINEIQHPEDTRIVISNSQWTGPVLDGILAGMQLTAVIWLAVFISMSSRKITSVTLLASGVSLGFLVLLYLFDLTRVLWLRVKMSRVGGVKFPVSWLFFLALGFAYWRFITPYILELHNLHRIIPRWVLSLIFLI